MMREIEHLFINKNEILPFAMMWIELESVTLSEISQRKTNTVRFHSYVEFKAKHMNTVGKKRGKP